MVHANFTKAGIDASAEQGFNYWYLAIDLNVSSRAETRTLVGGVYSYIHVLPNEFLFKLNSN